MSSPKKKKASKPSLVGRWTQYGRSNLLGLKIVDIRYLTDEEAEHLGWHSRPIVIQLANGAIIFPSRDDEGNDGGALFGQSPDGDSWTFPVLRIGDV